MDNAQIERQPLRRDQGKRQILEIGVSLAPGLVTEFVVGAAGHESSAAFLKVSESPCEFDQFSWTNESPVLGIEDVNGPFARIHFVVERGETGLFVVDAGVDFEPRKRIADGQHKAPLPVRESAAFIVIRVRAKLKTEPALHTLTQPRTMQTLITEAHHGSPS